MKNNLINKKLILEIVLFVNQELFRERIITYEVFKYTEDKILHDIGSGE